MLKLKKNKAKTSYREKYKKVFYLKTTAGALPHPLDPPAVNMGFLCSIIYLYFTPFRC